MEHKHTPGLWMAVGDYVFGGEDESFESVCLLKNTIYSDSKEANARLIAAAPDLLEACLAMIEWDDREKDYAVSFEARMGLCEQGFGKTRAAIAKATGEQK